MSKRYIVFERPQGSKCWTLARKNLKGGDVIAQFNKRESAVEFSLENSKTLCGWYNYAPMECFVAEVELPA
jgi:hypothetical protein